MWEQLAGKAVMGAVGGQGSKPQASSNRGGDKLITTGAFNVGAYEGDKVQAFKYGAIALVGSIVLIKVLK